MTPRIRVDDVGTDFHGALNVRNMEPASVSEATDRFNAALMELMSVDALTMEVARLRNAVQQQCHL